VIVVAAVSLWPVERVEPELSAEAAQNRRALALLPLAYDVTADDNVRVFAEAVHDELLSRLARIRALDKVVSRTAVSGYRETNKSARVIGRELGVGSVVEGRVHAAGDAVRLSVQLIDAPTNGVVWGDTYTGHMTAEDFFAVQSRLAIAIAEALEATLSATELARLREVPTTNTRAHDFYLSGNDYARRLNEPQKILPLLVQQYSRATEEDPRFALAWARLGMAHAAVYWYGMDRAPERVQRADSAIRTALALAPALPEAHVAKADFLWRVRGDYQGALAEISVAERDIPQEPNLQFLRASLYMRRGEWDLAIAGLDKALEFDPRNVVYLRQQSTSYMLKRDHAGVERNLARILEIAPDDGTAYVDRAHLGLYAHGDTTLANRYDGSPPAPSYATALAATHVRWLAAIFDRDYVRALSILDGSSEEPVFDGDLRNSVVPKALLYARTHLLAGNADEALRELRLAKSAIERQLASLEASEWAPLYIALAEVCAALGDKAGAVAALANSPRVDDAAQGSGLQLAAAIRVYLPLGDYDRALRELDAYLSSPGRWTIEGLSADPRLDPLRSDPRFVALVAKHARG
jgi:TolB-like protein